MNRQHKSKSWVNLPLVERIVMALYLTILVFANYFLWVHGTYQLYGVPLQIIVTTILLPIGLVFLVFWFAKKQHQHVWQSDDEE